MLLAGLEALIPFAYGQIFDLIIKGSDRTQPFMLLGVWFVAKIASNIMRRHANRKQFWLSDHCEKDFTESIVSHLLKLPMNFHEKENNGGIFSKISRGGSNLNNIIQSVVFTALSSFLAALIVLVVIFFVDYRLGLLTSIIIAIFVYEIFKYKNPLAKLYKEVSRESNEMNGELGDSLDNIKSIKYFTAEEAVLNKFNNAYKSILIKSDHTDDMWTRFRMNQSNVMDFGLIAIIGLSLYLVSENAITIGQMVMILGYMNVIYQPLTRLSDNYIMTEKGLINIMEVEELYKENTEEYDGGLMPIINGDIKFERISFSYDETNEALSNIDLEIKSGTTTALVGKSGSGKSTLIKLISRFIETNQGRVLLDGIDISKINLCWLRKNIAIVPQQVILFNGTIMENVRFGRRNATNQEVIVAAKAAHADEFIEKMPNGYKQVIGKWGVKLSVGQAQRIALARAILKNARIIILDEATSSLDSETEKFVQEAMENLKKDKTVIVIAHRLSTIISANNIIVMEEGKIIEVGTHEKLLAEGRAYRKFWELQTFSIPELAISL